MFVFYPWLPPLYITELREKVGHNYVWSLTVFQFCMSLLKKSAVFILALQFEADWIRLRKSSNFVTADHCKNMHVWGNSCQSQTAIEGLHWFTHGHSNLGMIYGLCSPYNHLDCMSSRHDYELVLLPLDWLTLMTLFELINFLWQNHFHCCCSDPESDCAGISGMTLCLH